MQPRPVFTWLVLSVICGATVYLLAPFSIIGSYLTKGMSQPAWSSAYSGYLQRAAPYSNPHAYAPQRTALKLAVLRNSPIEPEGFSLAIFSDRVAVDRKGNVFTLAERDFEGILQLAHKVAALPQTGEFRNQWRVSHPMTGRPIDRILSPRTELSAQPAERYTAEFVETSVYGFDKHRVLLKEPVQNHRDLPSTVWELTGLVGEAREAGGQDDEVVLERVRSVLGNVF